VIGGEVSVSTNYFQMGVFDWMLNFQLYDHAKHGWTAVCCITAALIVICIIFAFSFTGADPLLAKVMRQQHPPQQVKKLDEESNIAGRVNHTDVIIVN